jgi:GNAT superfamily N-acetyltransferase
MTALQVRPANLNDALGISLLFRSRVTNWQRLDADGRVQDLPYEALTIYERWLHGGAWMSVETGAIWLNYLLSSGDLALVASANDQITGFAQVHPGNEPPPYGKHLHIAHLIADPQQRRAIHQALLKYLYEFAANENYSRLTVSFSSYDTETARRYQEHGFSLLASVTQHTILAQTGQGFYKAVEHTLANPQQIEGWTMSIGRTESARYHWDHLWPAHWASIPEMHERRIHRLHFSIAGQEAFVCCREQRYDPRSAELFCWSPRPISTQLITAIRDWTHRANYRTLILAVPEDTLKRTGLNAEANPYRQDIYGADL